MRKILLATAAGFAALVADGVVAPKSANAQAAAAATPQPGFSIATSARYRFYAAIIDQDGDDAPGTGKLSNFDMNVYGRIRFDATGVSANGLRYGGRLEVRHFAQPGGPTSNAALNFRVANAFVGTPELGQLRFGSNGVLAVPQMFVGHIMGSIASGLLDGDAGDFVFLGQGGAVASSFWYSATGNINRATGIGYYSPQFFGFDFGISYAPNEYGFLDACNDSTASILNCGRTSDVNANGSHKYRNIIDAMIRYRGTFGPVGLAVAGGLRTASVTDAIAPATARKSPTVGVLGAEVTFAGLTVGGITTFGSANRGFASGASILPRNSTATAFNDNMFSWQLGARYTFGAFTVGAAYHEVRAEGDTTITANQKDRGFGLGGSYAVAPGMALFAEYLRSSVRETGRDFDSLKAGTQDKFKAQAFLLGLALGF